MRVKGFLEEKVGASWGPGAAEVIDFRTKDGGSNCYNNWLVVSNMNFIFHFIYGMSSFPSTNSIIFHKMVIAPPNR